MISNVFLSSIAATVFVIVITSSIMFGRSKWDPKNKHCYITGGSSGTGLALAILLTKKGAHVSIVARDKSKLEKALEAMEAFRQNQNQILRSYSFSLRSADSSSEALEAACQAHGNKAPDAVFTCAGASRPGFFIEQTEQTLLDGMDNAYWVQAWTALAATKKMVRDRVQGKIVFVASTLGLMSIVGYSSYAPGKYAIRGLAEGLRSEFILYGIDVHCFFPCTIYSPGLEEENKVKPKITLKIEEADSGLTPEQVAEGIFKAAQKGYHTSAGDLITKIFLGSTRGSCPNSNVFTALVMDLIAWIGIPIFRHSLDSTVRKHREEHKDYLTQKGFFVPSE